MRSHHNMSPNWRNDKRVEALLKQEMIEHQTIISSHHKEMQTLRDSLKIAMDKFDSLFKHSEQEMRDKTDVINFLISQMDNKIKIHEFLSSEHKQKILSIYQEMQDFYEIYIKKADVEKLKKEVDFQIKESTNNHLFSFQNLQRELKSYCHDLQQDLLKLKGYIENKFCEFDEKIEKKFSLSKMDKDSVLKEIRIYEKEMFIIEKKIENIYTLIQRINKKGDLCLKQE